MKLAQLMELFGKEIGFTGPYPQNDQGAYVVQMEPEVSFLVTDLNPTISLSCAIAPCPKQGTDSFHTQMLLANLFGQGTEGAVLGLTDDGNT